MRTNRTAPCKQGGVRRRVRRYLSCGRWVSIYATCSTSICSHMTTYVRHVNYMCSGRGIVIVGRCRGFKRHDADCPDCTAVHIQQRCTKAPSSGRSMGGAPRHGAPLGLVLVVSVVVVVVVVAVVSSSSSSSTSSGSRSGRRVCVCVCVTPPATPPPLKPHPPYPTPSPPKTPPPPRGGGGGARGGGPPPPPPP